MQIANCGLPIADCGLTYNPKSEIRNPKSRAAVTLIELMVVMLIISILAALVLGVAAVAGETARQAQSRHIVERMHTLLLEYYDTYKTRRVKLQDSVTTAIDNAAKSWPAAQKQGRVGQATAEARLYALREMMLMEVPDRWSDVLLNDIGSSIPNATPKTPMYLDVSGSPNKRTALGNVYLRRYLSLVGRTNTLTGQPNTAADLKTNQGAECLYMVITLACGDGEAKTLFAEKDIGDTDGDGAPEFLDGWGHPISFLRWAPGFDSQIQLNATNVAKMNSIERSQSIGKDHDPYDVYRADPDAFRLVPLIDSSGRDEALGIQDFADHVTWPPLSAIGSGVKPTSPYLTPRLTPYEKTSSVNVGRTDFMGIDLGDGTATDNVHNHLMGQR